MAKSPGFDVRDLRRFIHDLENVNRAVTPRRARLIGNETIVETKRLISRGISPIRGNGRFPAYKHAGNPRKYPRNQRRRFPGKRDRPVNLKLSGDFLNDLDTNIRNTGDFPLLEFGYFTIDSILKEEGHREGTGGQPKRPTIPDPSKGEQFAVSIERILVDGVSESIVDYFNNRVK